ncbi:hypothetical protein RCL1_002077 [Eukaryota sp. TZLM3-RCL]
MSVVSLDITHNVLSQRFAEIRFDLSLTIRELKERLHKHTGTQPEWMKIELRDFDGTSLGTLDDDDMQLGFFGVESNMTLHVIDKNPISTVHDVSEDLSKVKKFELTEEEYDSRQDSYRKWKQRNNFQCCSKNVLSQEQIAADLAALDISVGNRCEITLGAKRGTVRYIGELEKNCGGVFIGVELDEPLGKNDGSVGGVSYFTCQPNYGVFVKPDKLKVGDYPPLDDFDLSD